MKNNKNRISYFYDEKATGVRNGRPYKGIVFAIMGIPNEEFDDCTFDMLDDLFIRDISTVYGTGANAFEHIEYWMDDTYQGVAYCSKEDKFDLKKGMKIARNRLLKAYCKDKINRATIVYNDCKETMDSVKKYIDSMNEKALYYDGVLKSCMM